MFAAVDGDGAVVAAEPDESAIDEIGEFDQQEEPKTEQSDNEDSPEAERDSA